MPTTTKSPFLVSTDSQNLKKKKIPIFNDLNNFPMNKNHIFPIHIKCSNLSWIKFECVSRRCLKILISSHCLFTLKPHFSIFSGLCYIYIFFLFNQRLSYASGHISIPYLARLGASGQTACALYFSKYLFFILRKSHLFFQVFFYYLSSTTVFIHCTSKVIDFSRKLDSFSHRTTCFRRHFCQFSRISPVFLLFSAEKSAVLNLESGFLDYCSRDDHPSREDRQNAGGGDRQNSGTSSKV